MGGFQLWVNLPARQKMMDPRYQEVKAADIPLVEPSEGARVKVVAGEVGGTRGPVTDIVVEPEYLDIELKPKASFEHAVPEEHTAFAYLVQGGAAFDPEGTDLVPSEHLVIMKKDGAGLRVQAGSEGARLLLVAGKPLGEPVAWWGPIVMNNRHELEVAIEEYQAGTFIKKGKDRRGA
jgi:hypothetical protein